MVNRRVRPTLLVLAMSFAPIAATHAETGYELWLRYRLVLRLADRLVRDTFRRGRLLSKLRKGIATLDLRGWARDALARARPAQLLCREDCAGLCPVCGQNLNEAPGHAHERDPDPRWAKLRELKLE